MSPLTLLGTNVPAVIFGTEIQFWQVYTPFIGNLLYMVSHVLFSWKASQTSKL